MKKVLFSLFLITQLHAASDSDTIRLTNLSGSEILFSGDFCAATTDATIVSQDEFKHIRITNPAFIYTKDVPNFQEKFGDKLKNKKLEKTHIAALFIESATQGFFQITGENEIINGDVVTILPENRIRIERRWFDSTGDITRLTIYRKRLTPTTKEDLRVSNLLGVYLSTKLKDALKKVLDLKQ